MTFPRLVGVLTRELISYHEAGHIATAVMVGASVKSVEFFRGPPPYAKTSIDRTDPQAIFIACGGFAAEYHLFETKRLVDSQRQTADTALFLSEAQKNASEDVQKFDRALTRLGR